MSGGHFYYVQTRLNEPIEQLEEILCSNDFNSKTKKEIKRGLKLVKLAKIYIQRIDWLISGDDGEESFHTRLKEELQELLDAK